MKKFLPLLLILLSNQLFSQTNFRFADSTAQWNVIRLPFSCTAPPNSICLETLVAKFEKDTIIGSRPYQKLSVDPRFGVGQAAYLYEDSLKRVFQLILDSNQLVYDFSRHAGDTIPGNTSNVPLRVVVDSVDTVIMMYPRKRMFVNYWGLKDIWIEGIGSIYTNFLYPGGSALLVDYGIDSLLCYSEDNQVLYHLPTYQDCLIDTIILSGINNIGLNYGFAISPNPAFSFLTIQSENNFSPQTTFQLFDITGRMVLQKQLTGNTNRIELNEVSKGMYLYNVTSHEQKISSGKLAVQ